MKPKLTTKQQRLFNFIKSKRNRKTGMAKVTMLVMADYMGVKGCPSVTHMIDALVLKGYLVKHVPNAPQEGATYTFPD